MYKRNRDERACSCRAVHVRQKVLTRTKEESVIVGEKKEKRKIRIESIRNDNIYSINPSQPQNLTHMTNYGFITVAAAIPSVRVADVDYNVQEIERLVDEAESKGVELLVFPELCVTGYSCQDLFRSEHLLDASDEALSILVDYSIGKAITFVVGAPHRQDDRLMNSAVVICNGEKHYVHKTFLPNYNECYEKRWFSVEAVDAEPLLFKLPSGIIFGVELCEDLWSPLPPSSRLATAGADLILNLSANHELVGKRKYLLSLLAQQSARTMCGYVYSSCGFGESTQDVVFAGNAFIYENGEQLAQSERFSLKPQLIISQIDVEKLRAERRTNTTFGRAQATQMNQAELVCLQPDDESYNRIKREFQLQRTYDAFPFVPNEKDMNASCEEVFNIQVMGLAKRLTHINCRNVVIGISGGLDSTLALLVCVRTFDKLGLDRKGILGITMPGFGTTDRTHDNAVALMTELGITQREISIVPAVKQHFEDINHNIDNHDVTYENSQARYRTMILMDVANQVNGLVVGTGDLSELALGWATYNGDHMSMYGVNASVPKTLIRHLLRYIAEFEAGEATKSTLNDIIDTPISPELIPADENGDIKQKTEDLVGPYELHDFFIYHFMRYGFSPSKLFVIAKRTFTDKYDDATIKKWLTTFLRRFFTQQFKRSCLPDGPKVGTVSLSPRGDWRMPSDASSSLWLRDLD